MSILVIIIVLVVLLAIGVAIAVGCWLYNRNQKAFAVPGPATNDGIGQPPYPKDEDGSIKPKRHSKKSRNGTTSLDGSAKQNALPYPDKDGLPYPEKDENAPPYPEQDQDDPPYPKENQIELPYPEQNQNGLPHPKEKQPPYPEQDENGRSCPEANQAQLPYPDEDRPRLKPLPPPGRTSESVEEDLASPRPPPPYPAEDVNQTSGPKPTAPPSRSIGFDLSLVEKGTGQPDQKVQPPEPKGPPPTNAIGGIQQAANQIQPNAARNSTDEKTAVPIPEQVPQKPNADQVHFPSQKVPSDAKKNENENYENIENL